MGNMAGMGKKARKPGGWEAGWSEVYPACPVAPEDGTGVKPICLFCLTGAEIPVHRGKIELS